MTFLSFILYIIVSAIIVIGGIQLYSKYLVHFWRKHIVRGAEVVAYDYILTFKDLADISRFQNEPDLGQSFRIQTISKDTVVVLSPLQESQIREYMVQHFQMGPEKVVVARFFNPMIFI